MKVLLVVADCPGHFLEMTAQLALRLREQGLEPVFAVTSPFYERFKGRSLAEIGPVHYLSDYLEQHRDDPRVPEVDLDYWLTYSTFARTSYFHGRHINAWDDYRRLILFFRDLLSDTSVAAVWSEMPSSATIRVAQSEAVRRGLPFLGYISARVPNHFNVVRDGFGAELMSNPDPPDAVVGEPPDYMKNAVSSPSEHSSFRLLQEGAAHFLASARSRKERSLEMGDPMRVQLAWYRRQIQRKLYYRYAIRQSIFSPLPGRDEGQRSLVFPLHYRPEASTSVQAQHLGDDLETIRNVAFSLPPRATLFVKEHPAAIGLHSRRFYRELATLPSVRVLDIDPPLSKVIDRFDAVVTLTSTAAFEGLQRGVPAVVLGRVFFEDYPGAVRVRAFEDLPVALRRLLDEPPVFPSHAALDRYLRSCFAGTFNYMDERVKQPENVDRLAVPIHLAVGGRGGSG